MFNIGIDFGSTLYYGICLPERNGKTGNRKLWAWEPRIFPRSQAERWEVLTDFATAQPQKALWEERTMSLISYIPLLEKFRVTAEQYYKDDCAEKDSFQKE